MLGLVQNWFGPRCNPIGVDFGSDCLRMAQVHWVDNDWRLIAAASAPVPDEARGDPIARAAFFTQTIRDRLVNGGFHGRAAVLGLPAAAMCIQHLRMTRLDDEETKRALRWEARGKLPIDTSTAVLRHIIAGEIYVDQEPRNEVIVMAAKNETVQDMLQAASKAKLDVVGMNVEPAAILDCFSQIYRRQSDGQTINFFVDIGESGTRAVIARGRQILFARSIPIGGAELIGAVAEGLKTKREQARAMRIKTCHTTKPDAERAVLTPETTGSAALQKQIEDASHHLLDKLATELDLCRRYYETTFPGKPVDRLVFIGGESRHRWLCQHLARKLSLAAQLGDPLCRMAKWCEVGIESGIDRRQPQPAWTVAIGLSMGPPTAESSSQSTTSHTESRSQHELT
jgi:type IV pilus assembly protein PilM